MPDFFADTSGWGNLIDPTQTYHTLAASLYPTARQQQRKVITTNYIITLISRFTHKSAPNSETHDNQLYSSAKNFPLC